MKVTTPKEMYDSLAQMALDRGIELGLGRALNAQEISEDPILGPFIDRILDGMLGLSKQEVPS